MEPFAPTTFRLLESDYISRVVDVNPTIEVVKEHLGEPILEETSPFQTRIGWALLDNATNTVVYLYKELRNKELWWLCHEIGKESAGNRFLTRFRRAVTAKPLPFRDKFTKGWGTELYTADPDIYERSLSSRHPAKAAHGLLIKIFDHLNKTGLIKPGMTVLDPFGGTGRTAVVGAILGYDCTCIDVEPEFAEEIMPGIFEYARNKVGSQYWKYPPKVVLADARRLPFAAESFDIVVTSPPYADQIHQKSTEATLRALGKKGHEPCASAVLDGYRSTSSGQIGDLKMVRSKRTPESEIYPEAMFTVYNEMYRLLKPGGIMVTITKDGIKDGGRQRIGVTTKSTALAAGFKLADVKFAEVARPIPQEEDLFGVLDEPRLQGRVSYFRRWHYKKNPNSLIRYEHILFFQK